MREIKYPYSINLRIDEEIKQNTKKVLKFKENKKKDCADISREALKRGLAEMVEEHEMCS